jgi:hypothetical protein
MICSVKSLLREDLCVVQKKYFSVAGYMYDTYTWQKAKHITARVQLKKSVAVSLKEFRLGSGGVSIVGSRNQETSSEEDFKGFWRWYMTFRTKRSSVFL